MGLTDSKDFLSGKFTTAIIIDKGNRAFSVPIKYVIDDYFTTTIEKQRYVFKLSSKIYTWRQKGRKTMRFYLFTTDHYLPLSVQENKELELIISQNSLPKIDHQLLDLFNYLGKREKTLKPGEPFKEHDLDEIIEQMAIKETEYPEQVESLKNFFDRLDIKKILTPVRHLSEFLEGDLKTTDAKIFGDLESQVKRTEKEQKAMSNTVTDAKKPWLIIAIVCILIVGVAGFGIWAFQTGAFDHLLPQIGGGPAAPTTVTGIAQKYPTPEALKAAIDRGEIKESDLPPQAKEMLKNYKAPIVTPQFTNSNKTTRP